MTNDLRYAIRGLLRSPGFCTAAVLTLALGIGANTAIFSVLDAVLLRPLPYADSDRLVLIWGADQAEGRFRGQVSFTDSVDWRDQSSSFERLAAFASWRPIISGDVEPERIGASQVADGFLEVMGATPLMGRLLTPGDQLDGQDRVVVINHTLWQRRFDGDPAIIGRTVRLNLVPYEIVGVLRAGFASLPRGILAEPAELYRPLAEPYDDGQRAARHLRAVGRLRPEVTVAQARAEISSIAVRLAEQYPDSNAGYGAHVVGLKDDIVGDVRPTLLLLLGAVVLVLLIGCANVSNLLLARSAGRRREVAIRAALGAGRGTLVRQFLVESLLLALVGGGLGLLLTIWSVGLLEMLASGVHPALREIEINRSVLVFTTSISLLCGVVFGLAPALHASRTDLRGSLGEARILGTIPHRQRLRAALVVTQVAMALVLLSGAALLIQSVGKLQQVDPGFDASNKLVMDVWLPWKKYREGVKQVAFFREAVDKIGSLPGVESTGVVSVVPVGGSFDRVGIEVRDRDYPPGKEPSPDRFVVSTDYLRTMSIELLAGRQFDDRDVVGAQPVVLIGHTLAERVWPGEDPIGKQVRLPTRHDGEQPWRTVVGLVDDIKQYGLDRPGTMQIYLPQAQYPWGYMSFVVRTAGDPEGVAGSVRRAILELDADLPIFNLTTMDRVLAHSISLRRFSMLMLAAFAFTALVLSGVGVYGVIAYSVTMRTPEIGVRLALGAQRSDVLRLVLRQGVLLATAGLAIGLVASWSLTRLLETLLFEVTARDPLTFAIASVALLLVAVLACSLPARRAMQVDPMTALRQD